MSAINQLKNFAISITGKLFTSSKKNGRQDELFPGNANADAKTGNGTVRIIREKKDQHQSGKALSDFTIF